MRGAQDGSVHARAARCSGILGYIRKESSGSTRAAVCTEMGDQVFRCSGSAQRGCFRAPIDSSVHAGAAR
jgi:hypothetical protein